MQKLLKLFKASEGMKQSLISVVGNTFATGLSAVALILVTRLLDRSAYGEFSLGFALIMIINRINDAGLNAALVKFVPQAENHDQVNALFSYVLKVKLMLSAGILLVGFVLTPFLAQLLKFEHLSILYLAILLSVASTWYEQLLAMLQGLHHFTQTVVVNGLQSGLKMIGLIVFYLLNIKNQVAIFSFYMIAPMLPMMAGGVLLPKWLKIRFRQDFTVERKLLSAMAAHSAVSLIAAGVIENIDVFFVQRYLSTSEVGLLSAVSKISMMIMLVAYSLGNVLNPRVARYHHRADLAAYLQKAAILCVISLLGFLAFIPLARLSILLTIGSQYQDGLPILLILVGSAFLTIALIPFVALFYSFKAEWYFSLSGIGQLLIVLIGNGVFVPQFGLAASAWTRLVARLFLFIFTVVGGVFLYWRHTKKSPAL